MSIRIIDTLDPLGNFPAVNAEDVQVGSNRLDSVIAEKSDKSYVDIELAKKATIDQVNSKADANIVAQMQSNLNLKADVSTVSSISGRVSDVETEQASLNARMDAFTHLSEGSTTGDAELADIRVGENGVTYSDAGTAVRSQIKSINGNLSKLRCEYVDISKIQIGKYYNLIDQIKTVSDDEYAIYVAFRVESGTYFFCNFSHFFSWFVYDNDDRHRFSEVVTENVMNCEYSITFTEPATIYATLYKPSRFQARFSNKNLNSLSHYGYSDDNNDLTFSKPWALGSWNYEKQSTNYYDTDFKYTTSFNMQFDKDVYILNPDTSKYLYYVGYISAGGASGETNYSNDPCIKIPANTLFRVGVKYLDNRTLTNETKDILINNSIKIVGNEYALINNEDEKSSNVTVVNVGPSRTYKKIQDAVNSITDCSKTNKYVVLVDEGEYDITNDGINFIPIKPYVTIKGVNKAKTIIRFQPSQKSATKNAFQQISGFDGYGEVCDFTVVTNNVKGALHLDDPSWKGEIYFHDITAFSYGTEEVFNPEHDYYHNMDASLGVINLATHLNQKIIIENINTNGYIYSHSLPANSDYTNTENAGTFIVRNCVCDWIGVYGNGEKARKKCIIENNKCHFIKICFIDSYNLNFMCWDVELVNNNTDFIAMQYFPYNSSEMKSLSHNYYSKNPFADSNIHKVVENKSGSDIGFGAKVKYTDRTKRYITLATSDDYDAVTTQQIGNGYSGVVQDGGNKESYLAYLVNHEKIST